MNLSKLDEILANEPSYRVKQVRVALFKNLIDNWDDVTTLSKDLRETLKAECPLEIDVQVSDSGSKNTEKVLITLDDDKQVETVLMCHPSGRNSVCVSCQVGCSMGCVFCSTGKMGTGRDLTEEEIIDQVLYFSRKLKANDERIDNITFMGMGEPFLNYDNVLAAIKFLNSEETINLGARHFAISTCGLIDGIEKLTKEPMEINLAISLNASNDKVRSKIMPINKRYKIKDLLEAVDEYIKITRRKVMFEYVLIDGVNDSDEQARELVKLMNNRLYFVNLIPYNTTGNFKPSPSAQVKRFHDILERGGVSVTQRLRFGRDINAACGQLITKSGR
jgi:23S rRNA (adenine2503-C2)-methyltransferase